MNDMRCTKTPCDCPPIGRVETARVIYYGLGTVLPRGEYDVHHESPHGPVLYETNDLGHNLQVNESDVRRLA